MIVVPGTESVKDWVAMMICGARMDWGPSESLAVLRDDGSLAAAVVYSEYRPGADVRASIAATRADWATRGVLRELFRYPFETLGVPRITILVSEKNEKSRKMVKKMGFSQEGVHPLAWEGRETALSYGMLRQDCRWIDG